MQKEFKEIAFSKTFDNNGEDFSAYHQAIDFVKQHGFSYGSMQREAPIGLAKGEGIYISKWSDLGEDKNELDGFIDFPEGSPRNGRAIVKLFINL